MFKDTLLVGCGENQIKQIDKCIAIDISEEYLKKSKSSKPNNLYLLADVNKLPFINNNFNKVICTEVLEHTENPNDSLSEISRVIKDKGSLYLSVPLEKPCRDLAEIFPAYKRDFYEGHHKSEFTEQFLFRLLKENGFQTLRVKYIGRKAYLFWQIWARLVKIFNLDVYIEENGKLCLKSNNKLNLFLFRNFSRAIRILALILYKILPNKKIRIFVEAKK